MSKKDEYAREVLRAGRDLGITPRGMVIAFAIVAVECNWVMYANAKVPESLNIPTRRSAPTVSPRACSSSRWCGATGRGGATCMDPYKSAVLFFERLKKRDYNNGDPGAHAQAIQGSAFPDRYATRMGEAQAHDRTTGTTEAPMGVLGDPVWLEDIRRPALGGPAQNPSWMEGLWRQWRHGQHLAPHRQRQRHRAVYP